MKYSGIGGQAVLEGIMMKNGDRYAIAVRKPDHEIEIKEEEFKGTLGSSKFCKLPFIRGTFNLIDSLTLGMKTIMYSASFYEEDEEPKDSKGKKASKEKKEKTEEQKAKEEKGMMFITLMISIILAVGLFMVLPVVLSNFIKPYVPNHFLMSLIEGLIRVTIFLIYMVVITLMNDIKRTYMYHGGEHKCINCLEHGMFLTVDNVRKSSRFHKRCGTSFLLIVMLISVLVFMFVRTDVLVLKIVSRILLLPVVAGISYEFLRWTGTHDNGFIDFLSKPGLLLQRLTTKEPDDEMIEVAIAATEAIFDWKAYLKENFPKEYEEQIQLEKPIYVSTEE